MDVRPTSLSLLNFATAAGLVALTVLMLVVGQNLLLPLVIAVAFWFLINVLAGGFAQIRIRGWQPPSALCFALAIATFLAAISVMVQFVSGSINDLGAVAREYESNLLSQWAALPFSDTMPIEGLAQLWPESDLSALFTELALSFTGIAADGTLILIYTGFLLFEQRNFDAKLAALLNNEQREQRVRRIISRVRADIRKYIGIKLFTSALTATLSYFVLRLLNVDFAEVWAVLIFLLNFIPTIGSIIATIFPAFVALAQTPDGIALSLLVLLCIGGIQILVGNIIEPRLLGTSLNISPIVILFNLALWGYIWGVAGLFLCMPLLIIAIIILSHFPRTRPVAILLSSDGQIVFPEE